MKSKVKIAGCVGGVVVGAAFPLLLRVEGLSFQAVCALGVLAGAICWWVCGVLPEFVTALIMAALFIVVAAVPTDVAFSAFSDSTWWLLVAAFGLGLGMQKSGLMRRMALGVLRVFPRTYKSQVAGLMAAGTFVGPFIPSLSAKAVMLAPLAQGISDSLGFQRKSRQADGLFLAMFTGLRNVGPAVISSSIIGYGLLGLLPDDVAAQFDMVHWFLYMVPWFATVTILNYVAITKLYAPRSTRVAGAAQDGKSACVAGTGKDAGSAGSSSSSDGAPGRLGPFSLHEKQMLVIMAACVALWVTEPLHQVEAHVVALGALVASLACGVFSAKNFRGSIAWDSLVFIGVALGLADVFAYLGIDTWIVSTCQPVFTVLAANPYLFVAGIGVITVLLRFVIVSEMAYVNIFMAFMVPLAMELGISPWVVGVSVYCLVNPWFVLYQNPIYLSAYYAVDGQMVRHADMAKYCMLYVLICLAGLMVSVPVWQATGLL